jgi:hypothetical protein
MIKVIWLLNRLFTPAKFPFLCVCPERKTVFPHVEFDSEIYFTVQIVIAGFVVSDYRIYGLACHQSRIEL